MDDRAALAGIRAEKDTIKRAALIGQFVHAKGALIRTLSEKYAKLEKTSACLDDIHQAGRIGFIKAIETWDPDKGALSTWVGWGTRRAVQDMAHTEQPIKLPQIRGTTAERERVAKAVRENPDVTAAELGINDGMLERVKKTIGLRFVSVDMFGDGDDAPARARRIERRITEQTDVDGADDELDARRAVMAVIAAVRSCATVARMTLDDVLAGAARALGCDTFEAPPAAPKPRTKKAHTTCPNPPPSTRLRPLPLPPPRLVALAKRPRLVALPLRKPSAPPPLRLRSLRKLPTIPQRSICLAPSPCFKKPALCLPRFALTCETPSIARKAA